MNGIHDPPGFLLYERRCWWAPLLRRMAPGWTVREVRGWEECRRQWGVDQLLVLEATSESLEQLPARLRLARQTVPAMPVGVVMRAELLPLRWTLREAGATLVASTALELRSWGTLLARWHETRLAHAGDVDRGQLLSWSEAQSRLPWEPG